MIVLLSVVWLVLELDDYTRLDENKIVLNPLFGFGETTYPYHRITHLVEATHLVAPNGKLVERTRQFVLFDDGESWCHDALIRPPQPQYAAMQRVRRRLL